MLAYRGIRTITVCELLEPVHYSTQVFLNRLFKSVQEHRSLAALRQYERTTDEQQVAKSEILAGDEHCGLAQVMDKDWAQQHLTKH